MSRDILDLQHDVRHKAREHMDAMEREGVPILIYSTLRSMEEQARLFRQGRSTESIRMKAEELRDDYGRPDLADILLGVGPQYGPKRTNAAPGQSIHNYGLAYDGAPMRNGDIVWGTTDEQDMRLWQLYGRTAKKCGLAWGGDWTSFTDMPHCYQPEADWRELIRKGR